jgi:hypothetical protein
MRDLSSVVEGLRLVQRARKRFLELWTLEKDVIIPMLDRMADDLQEVILPAVEGDDDDPGSQPPESGRD